MDKYNSGLILGVGRSFLSVVITLYSLIEFQAHRCQARKLLQNQTGCKRANSVDRLAKLFHLELKPENSNKPSLKAYNKNMKSKVRTNVQICWKLHLTAHDFFFSVFLVSTIVLLHWMSRKTSPWSLKCTFSIWSKESAVFSCFISGFIRFHCSCTYFYTL